jgi:hypothetical protein
MFNILNKSTPFLPQGKNDRKSISSYIFNDLDAMLA